ncbi:MAG TPA: Xaa-Pro peptidase family protein [Candidatus Ozemobacteraceae bacterium]|nr:Xaa-Pro peptidase family protein [Candidatus Ozemobacteraceae bacterium]
MKKNPCLERQQRVVDAFPAGLDALLVTNLSNVRYLTGFSGSSGVVILEKHKTVFVTDFRYQEQSTNEVGNAAQILVYQTAKASSDAVIGEHLKKSGIRTLGIESTMSLGAYEAFSKSFGGTLKTTSGLVEAVRMIKGEEEMTALRRAFEIGDKSFAKLLRYIKPGKREIEIAARLEYIMRIEGSDGPSFDSIVASGERSSCPHAHPTDRKVKAGEMVKIDFGAIWKGYHSDMTRTVFVGKADAKFREIYGTVLEAQRRAVAALRPGAVANAVDAVARDHIAAKQPGDVFGHGLGHAVGLDIHESPSLSKKCDTVLRAGMVVTVEPGIYLPGWGGVRIEDVYRIDTELERLTNTPNDLLELPV